MKPWLLALVLGLAACGSGGECPVGRPLTSPELEVYQKVKDCTGLNAPAPEYKTTGTKPCPVSKRNICIAEFEDKPCEDEPTAMCGVSGAYLPKCGGTLYIPDQYNKAFAHETIHHLLKHNGREDWKQHTAREFKCEVFFLD